MKRTIAGPSGGSGAPTVAAAVRLQGRDCGSPEAALSQPPAWTSRSLTVTAVQRGSTVALAGGSRVEEGERPVLEGELAGVDQGQDGDGGDRLGDAGDAEARLPADGSRRSTSPKP
jgi:hypothetical protein